MKVEIAFRLVVKGVSFGQVWLTPEEVATLLLPHKVKIGTFYDDSHTWEPCFVLKSNPDAIYWEVVS